MALHFGRFATRDKLMLAGLFLSKYDALGLKKLGFETFAEAFNVIGYALGARPASIKNYRDEFDPFFPIAARAGINGSFANTAEKCLKRISKPTWRLLAAWSKH